MKCFTMKKTGLLYLKSRQLKKEKQLFSSASVLQSSPSKNQKIFCFCFYVSLRDFKPSQLSPFECDESQLHSRLIFSSSLSSLLRAVIPPKSEHQHFARGTILNTTQNAQGSRNITCCLSPGTEKSSQTQTTAIHKVILARHTACGILFCNQGLNLGPPQSPQTHQVLTTGPPGNFLKYILKCGLRMLLFLIHLSGQNRI